MLFVEKHTEFNHNNHHRKHQLLFSALTPIDLVFYTEIWQGLSKVNYIPPAAVSTVHTGIHRHFFLLLLPPTMLDATAKKSNFAISPLWLHPSLQTQVAVGKTLLMEIRHLEWVLQHVRLDFKILGQYCCLNATLNTKISPSHQSCIHYLHMMHCF